jgi:hypothetical protein
MAPYSLHSALLLTRPSWGSALFYFRFLFNPYLTFISVSYEQIIIYKDSLPRPNPDVAGPIVRRPMGLPVTARCEPGTVVTPLALDDCATREPHYIGKRVTTLQMLHYIIDCSVGHQKVISYDVVS